MSERQAIVSRILKFSCVDGPGNRLVLFLQGCNFNCINCHNPIRLIIVITVGIVSKGARKMLCRSTRIRKSYGMRANVRIVISALMFAHIVLALKYVTTRYQKLSS